MKLNPLDRRGRFIVIYGSNNLGKTTQMRMLNKEIINNGKQSMYIKYPLYQLEPTGLQIFKYLREEPEEIEELEFQKLFAKNRRDFQDTLIKILNAGVYVIAEDYTGTGIAWGMTRGIKLEDLLKINKGLIDPDLAILLDGERFTESIEKGHRNEDDAQKNWDRNRKIHQKLAEKFGWKTVNANQKVEEVHKDVWKFVKKALK